MNGALLLLLGCACFAAAYAWYSKFLAKSLMVTLKKRKRILHEGLIDIGLGERFIFSLIVCSTIVYRLHAFNVSVVYNFG